MKRNTSCKFVELLRPLFSALGWQFFELLSQPLQRIQVNMRTTELSCSGLTSHLALDPSPIKLGREPKRQHLNVL